MTWSGSANRGPRPRFIARLSLIAFWITTTTSADVLEGGATIHGVEAIGQMTLPLIGVVALLLILAWVVRRFNLLQAPGGASLRVLGGLRVGGRERLLLLEVADRRLLVGVSPAGIRTLLVLDEDTTRGRATEFEDALAVGRAAVARLGEKQ